PGPCAQPNLCFYNDWYTWRSTPGLVEGDRWHSEPGLADTVKLASTSAELYFYVAIDPVHSTPLRGAFGPDAKTFIGVYAQVETGLKAFHGHLLMKGDTGAQEVGPTSLGNAQIINLAASGEVVYEFKVPLVVSASEIPASAE